MPCSASVFLILHLFTWLKGARLLHSSKKQFQRAQTISMRVTPFPSQFCVKYHALHQCLSFSTFKWLKGARMLQSNKKQFQRAYSHFYEGNPLPSQFRVNTMLCISVSHSRHLNGKREPECYIAIRSNFTEHKTISIKESIINMFQLTLWKRYCSVWLWWDGY